MKHFLPWVVLLILLTPTLLFAQDANEDGYHDGDVAFLKALLEQNPDSHLEEWTATNPALWKGVTWNYYGPRRVEAIDISDKNVSVIPDGISELSFLETFYCQRNSIKRLDVSNNTILKTLFCYGNGLEYLNVSGATNLQHLQCHNNKLDVLDVTSCLNLKIIGASENEITELDLVKNVKLEQIICTDNNLTNVDLSGSVNLNTAWFGSNQLRSIDASNCTSLEDLLVQNNQLECIDVSGAVNLRTLTCWDNNLEALDLSNNHNLENITCLRNKLRDIELSPDCDLKYVNCINNFLTFSGLSRFLERNPENFEYAKQNKCFEEQKLMVNDFVDYSSEAVVFSEPTKFKWKKRIDYFWRDAVVDGDDPDIISDGAIFTFKKDGEYSCRMENVKLPKLADGYLNEEYPDMLVYNALETKSIFVSPLIEAKFECENTIARLNEEVSFVNNSYSYEGDGFSSLWDFGDGLTSTDKHPKHAYNTPGLYTVSLKVSDGTNEDVLIKSKRVLIQDGYDLKTDSVALVALYNNCNGPKWYGRYMWLRGPLKDWTGVTIENNRVTGVVLHGAVKEQAGGDSYVFSYRLKGELPEEMKFLSQLDTLNLSCNEITGGLFNVKDAFPNLSYLNLSNNKLEFDDLELLGASAGDGFELNPQYDIGDRREEFVTVGEDYVLNSSIGGSGNLYQWFKGEEMIGTSQAEPQYTIEKVGVDDIADYHMEVTSTVVENVTVKSNVIKLNLDVPVAKSDSLALVALYNNCNGAAWIHNDNWLEGRVRDWYGVTIENDRVVKLDMPHQYQINMAGRFFSLPDRFFDLTELRFLDLQNLGIYSEISPLIGELNKLTHLNLSSNRFKGEIPVEIGQLTNVRYLDLSGNELVGMVPSELGNLSNLEYLALCNNMLVAMGDGLANLKEIRELILFNNKFKIEIPDYFWNYTKLRQLNISSNEFYGSISSDIENLQELVSLYLQNNNLSGDLPNELTQLSKIRSLWFSRNNFTYIPDMSGSIVSGFAAEQNNLQFDSMEPNMGVLSRISPQGNFGEEKSVCVGMGKSCTLSVDCAGSANKYAWYKDGNLLAEGLTESSYVLDNFSEADKGIYVCKVSNDICSGLVLESKNQYLMGLVNEADSLALVALYNATDGENWIDNENWLSGPLADWKGVKIRDEKIVGLDLANNNQTGVLPEEMKVLTDLEMLNLNDNKLSGGLSVIPSMVNLQEIHLENNELTDEIPVNIGNLTKLRYFNASSNELSGNIPATFGALLQLNELWLNDNKLDGALPDDFGNLANLKLFHLENNEIDRLPDLSNTSFRCSGEFYVNENKLTFADLVPNMNVFPKREKFFPQKKLGEEQVLDISKGKYTDLGFSYRVHGHDEYRWFKYSEDNPEKITFVGNVDWLKLGAVDYDDEGVYFCRIYNSYFGDMCLESERFIVSVHNDAPVANAGRDRTTNEGNKVGLYGFLSSDVNRDQLTYKWTAPEGIELDDPTSSVPTFIAPEVTKHTKFVFSLVVNDGMVDSEPDEMIVTVFDLNSAPVAEAGDDISVDEGSVVTLDGFDSFDVDDDDITYSWTAPEGIVLSDASAAQPTFTAPEVAVDTDFVFSLVVNDGTTDSAIDEVVVTVAQVNKVPVAVAGDDMTVDEGSVVTLDGSGSSDDDDDDLSYSWTAPEGIVLSDASAAQPTFTAPEVAVDTDFVFSLVVNDGTTDSAIDEVVVTVAQVNKVPVAVAGDDMTVDEGSVVTLDGSGSSDDDDDDLSYSWTAPEGIVLSDASAAQPTFTAPEVAADTDLVFSLVVNDSTTDSEIDEVVVTVAQVNKVPVAVAGDDMTVDEGSVVSLDGAGSSDADGDDLSYSWTAPEGIVLSDANAMSPTFTAPEVAADTDFVFSLAVNDGTTDSAIDEVVVTVAQVNKVPVAVAGDDMTVDEGSVVSLDGAGSSDADDDDLSYSWTAPEGIVLSDANVVSPTFTAPEVAADIDFVFSLVVNDGTTDSAIDEVVVTVAPVSAKLVLTAELNGVAVVPENVAYKLYKKEGEIFNLVNMDYSISGDETMFAVENGTWIVEVVSTEDETRFMPTYASGTVDWDKAEEIVIDNVTSVFKTVVCTPFPTIETGTYEITGHVYDVPENGQTKSIRVAQSADGRDPIANVAVHLYKHGEDECMAIVKTDENGYYQFDDLVEGDYDVCVDIPGFTDVEVCSVAVGATAIVEEIVFVVDEGKRVVTDVDLVDTSNLKVYPVPTTGLFTIEGLPMYEEVTIRVVDGYGRVVRVLETSSNKVDVDITNAVPGVYFVVFQGYEHKPVKVVKR